LAGKKVKKGASGCDWATPGGGSTGSERGSIGDGGRLKWGAGSEGGREKKSVKGRPLSAAKKATSLRGKWEGLRKKRELGDKLGDATGN